MKEKLKNFLDKVEKFFDKIGALRLVSALFLVACVLPPALAFGWADGGTFTALVNLESFADIALSIAKLVRQFAPSGPNDYLFAAALILWLRKYKTALALAPVGYIWVYACIFAGNLVLDYGKRADVAEPLRVISMSMYTGDTISLFILSWMLPSIVAFWRKKEYRWRYLVANLTVAIVPAVWPVMLFFAFRDKKEVIAEAKKLKGTGYGGASSTSKAVRKKYGRRKK